MSTQPFDLRPRIVNGFLLPVLFALAIAAAVIAGDDSGSFWVGLLAFLVTWKSGRVARRLVRGLVLDAVHAAIWPGSATAYAFLFVWAGLPRWLGVLLAMLVAEATKVAVSPLLPRRRKLADRWGWFEEWGMPELDRVIEGRWRRKED